MRLAAFAPSLPSAVRVFVGKFATVRFRFAAAAAFLMFLRAALVFFRDAIALWTAPLRPILGRARLIPIRRLPQTAFWRPTPPDPQPHPLLIPTIRPFHLDLPDGETIFNAAIQQSNDASQPPAMVLLFNDRVFINRLTREGNALDPAVQAIGVFLFHPQ